MGARSITPASTLRAGLHRIGWPGFAVITIGILWFLPGIAARELVFDDHALILGDPAVVTPGAWPELLARNYWGAQHPEGGLWRPLPKLLQAFAYSIGGRDPGAYWPFAVVGLTARIAFALVMYLLLVRLLYARKSRTRRAVSWTAAAASIAFLVHPAFAPAGIPVMGWPDLISTGFILFCCWQACGRHHERLRSILAVCGALAAIASKETGAMTAAIAFLAMLAVRRRAGDAFKTAFVIGAASLILWGVRGHLLGEVSTPGAATSPLAREGVMVRLFTCGHLFALSVGQLLAPSHFQVWYDPDSLVVKSLVSREGGIGVLTVMGFALALLLALRRPAMRLAVGTFVLAYLPVSNLFVLIGEMRADRFLFLPFAALIPALIVWLLRSHEAASGPLRGRPRAAAAIAAAVIASWGWLGLGLASTWSTNLALWEGLAQTDPIAARSHRALINLGNARLISGDLAGAEATYQQAVTQYQSFKGRLGMANVYMADGSAPLAEVRFRGIIDDAQKARDPATASLAFVGLVEALIVQAETTGDPQKLNEAFGLLGQALESWSEAEFPTQRQQALRLLARADALRRQSE